MVVDNPDDRWREVAVRLIADTELFERRFDRDFFGDLGPRKPTGAYVLEASRLVITRVKKLTDRLDALYGTELDPTTRQRLHTAQQQLDATIEALTGLPELLDPHYRR